MTLDRAVGYHQVQEVLLSASRAVELVKTAHLYVLLTSHYLASFPGPFEKSVLTPYGPGNEASHYLA